MATSKSVAVASVAWVASPAMVPMLAVTVPVTGKVPPAPVTVTVPSMMLWATAGSPAEPAPVLLRYFVAPDASRNVSFATVYLHQSQVSIMCAELSASLNSQPPPVPGGAGSGAQRFTTLAAATIMVMVADGLYRTMVMLG